MNKIQAVNQPDTHTAPAEQKHATQKLQQKERKKIKKINKNLGSTLMLAILFSDLILFPQTPLYSLCLFELK